MIKTTKEARCVRLPFVHEVLAEIELHSAQVQLSADVTTLGKRGDIATLLGGTGITELFGDHIQLSIHHADHLHKPVHGSGCSDGQFLCEIGTRPMNDLVQ